MGKYDEVLVRLEELRKKAKYTQEKMGEILGIKQEQYFYIQKGYSKLSDKHLNALYKIGWNIDYLITGHIFKRDTKTVEKLFKNFEKEERESAMKYYPSELLMQRIVQYKDIEVDAEKQRYLNMFADMLKNWDTFSMLRFVRSQMKINQVDMAEKVGVGIKKYRALEKESRYPDAEMLANLYEATGYEPSLFLNLLDRRIFALSHVYELLKPEDKKCAVRLMYYVKFLMK